MLDRFQIVSMLDMERLELGNIVSAAAYLNAVGGEFRLLVQMMRHGKMAGLGLGHFPHRPGHHFLKRH